MARTPFIVRWTVTANRTWDGREAGLDLLLTALEKDVLSGIDLQPLDGLYASLDDELQGYVDDILERPSPHDAKDNAAQLL